MLRAKFCLAVTACVMGVQVAGNICRAEQPVYFRCDFGLSDDDSRALPDTLDPKAALWRQPLPPGQSTPTIVGDRIFLTGYEGNDLLTLCLDRATGKELWRQAVHVESLEKFHHEMQKVVDMHPKMHFNWAMHF